MKTEPLYTDTIVALSTPPGRSAIAVIRLSGPAAITATAKMFRGGDLLKAPSHTLRHGWLYDPDSGEALDEVVVGIFRAPRSYTREDVAEISCHGNPLIASRILEALMRQGVRLAEPGEFTLRGFRNQAFDLAQAEAVADLIASESTAGLRTALQQLKGVYSQKLKAMRQELLDLAGWLELELDFSEEDVVFADRSRLLAGIDALLNEINTLAAGFRAGNAFKEGFPTVIAGRPNAGKSTLLNALLGEERAIVSPIPGTTRDVIEDRFHLDAYLFRLVDTAGLRVTNDPVELEGVRRTYEQVSKAAVILYVYDVGEMTPDEAEAEALNLEGREDALRLLLANKVDAHPKPRLSTGPAALCISATTGEGLEDLNTRLVSWAKGLSASDTIITNIRHIEALIKCGESLNETKQVLQSGASSELAAIDLRRAMQFLGEITGEVLPDDILGNIFSRFCIGK